MLVAPDLILPETEIEGICRKYRVQELALFGSALRGEAGPESDLDFIVDFLPGAHATLFDIAGMAEEMSKLLGRRVDLGTKRSLKPAVRREVLTEARVVYAA